MNPEWNAPAPEQAAQESIDRAVAATDAAMQSALGGVASSGAAVDMVDAVTQAEQALAAALGGVSVAGNAAMQAMEQSNEAAGRAVDAAQEQAERAMAASMPGESKTQES